MFKRDLTNNMLNANLKLHQKREIVSCDNICTYIRIINICSQYKNYSIKKNQHPNDHHHYIHYIQYSEPIILNKI